MKKFLSNYKSTIILLAAIIVGAIIGILFQEKAAVLKPLCDLFINLLLVIIVPLIFLTITTSITKMKTPKRLGKIMVTIIGTFVVTSIIAVFVGFASTYFVKLVNPEDGEKIKQALEQDVGNDETSGEEKEDEPTIAERTVNLLTVNDFSKLLSKDNIIAVLVFSILFGVAINMAGEKGKQVKEFVQSANEVVANIVKRINPIKNWFAPPLVAILLPIKEAKINGPNAAIAAVHPITPAAWRWFSEKIIGYCLKVPALPIPVKKNITKITPTKSGNCSILVGTTNPWLTKITAPPKIPNPVIVVNIAPPTLSATNPKTILLAEPIKGP